MTRNRCVRRAVAVLLLGISTWPAGRSVAENRPQASDRVAAKPKHHPAAVPMSNPNPRISPVAVARQDDRTETLASPHSPGSASPEQHTHPRQVLEWIRLELEEGGGIPKITGRDPNHVAVEELGTAGRHSSTEVAAGTGACCTACPNAACQNNVTESACVGAGGAWRGKGSTCTAFGRRGGRGVPRQANPRSPAQDSCSLNDMVVRSRSVWGICP